MPHQRPPCFVGCKRVLGRGSGNVKKLFWGLHLGRNVEKHWCMHLHVNRRYRGMPNEKPGLVIDGTLATARTKHKFES